MEGESLMDLLENVVSPMYYQKSEQWPGIIRKSAKDVVPALDSDGMIRDYDKWYTCVPRIEILVNIDIFEKYLF